MTDKNFILTRDGIWVHETHVSFLSPDLFEYKAKIQPQLPPFCQGLIVITNSINPKHRVFTFWENRPARQAISMLYSFENLRQTLSDLHSRFDILAKYKMYFRHNFYTAGCFLAYAK